MELTKLNMISDFVSPVVRVPQVYNSLWKWGALILALIATFTSISTRIKHIIIRVRSIKRSSSKQLLQCFDDDFDFSDDEDDTLSTPSDDDETDDENSVDGHDEPELRRDSFSWSDFSAGNSVVKLWDSFGLNLDFQDSSENENPTWGLDKDLKISDFFAGKNKIPAAGKSSPAVVYLADMSENDRFVLGAYDRRISNDFPVVCAEWGPRSGNAGSRAAGELRMRGLRNVRTPLNNLTESDVETWWDADAVIVN
ncbi:hypothetical protein POM88_015132 [Heracleum sosnowskyi]|uniref:Uncharacterized protein n=1 Tax=Heracleum sosnowskyi TaxID=360622 RepID=A0AAD8IL13_9APIA|nr:hypothetical protein POM88_015132 [Heracleum sosnowskyi]